MHEVTADTRLVFYTRAFLQNSTHFASSVIRSEPCGTWYSISITLHPTVYSAHYASCGP